MDVFEFQLAKHFDKAARKRALDLFHHGRVESFDAQPSLLVANVVGSADEVYSVRVQYADREPTRVSCSCPRFKDGHYCKHILATLIEADEYLYTEGMDRLFDEYPVLGPLERASEKALANNALVAASNQPQPDDWHQPLRRLIADAGAESIFETGRNDGTARELRAIINASMSTECKTLRVYFETRDQTRAGRWGRWKLNSVDPGNLDRFDRATQLAVNDLIARNEATVARPEAGYRYSQDRGSHYSLSYESVALRQPSCRDALSDLARSGQLFWVLDGSNRHELKELTWDESTTPWRFEVDITEDGNDRVLTGVFRREAEDGSETTTLRTVHVIAAVPGLAMVVPGPDEKPGWLAPLEACSRHWLKYFMANDSLRVPSEAREEFIKITSKLGGLPSGNRPADWSVEVLPVEPTPLVRLQRPGEHSRCRSLIGNILFRYHEREIDPEHAEEIIETDEGLVRRDGPYEQARIQEVVAFPGRDLTNDRVVEDVDGHFAIAPRELPSFVTSLVESGWSVEADGKTLRAGGNYWMSVEGRQETGIDWFDLEGEASFGKAAARIPELLAAIRRGKDYVVLDDGSHGLLPSEWIEKFKPLAGMATDEGGVDGAAVASFRSSQALLLDTMLAEHNVEINFAQSYLDLCDRIARAADPKPKGRPPGFRGTLRDYQKQGVGWLSFLRELELCGCLADDMGLGKTIQVLAHLEHVRRALAKAADAGDEAAAERNVFLAVVPKSLVFNWIDEAARFTPKLRVGAYHGSGRQALLADIDQYDLLVTTYGTMRIDIEKLKSIPFDTVVLDESQAIKNPMSLASKATRLLDAKHRIAMTGTPVENHLGELWSLFEFLNPGMLGRSSVFREAIRETKPTDEGGHRFDAVRALGDALRPFLLRRTKQAVLTELPPKTEQQIHVELSKADRKAYNELAAHYRAQLDQTFAEKGFKKSQIVILEALLRLRQAACHPGLLDPSKRKKKTGKVEVLLEQIEEVIASGHKALVFSQFVQFLDIVRHHLDKARIPYEYLDGGTRDRKTPVDRFQNDPNMPLFLVSLKAGGHGLNLTAADHVFILDPWWNPAVEAQAVDRAHRMGQQRPVIAARLIARDTVEEKIETLKASKKELAEALMSEGSAVPRGLTQEDVALLLS